LIQIAKFEDNKRLGVLGERLVSDRLRLDYLAAGININIFFSTLEEDKKGVDFVIKSDYTQTTSYQIKTQAVSTWNFNSFLLELKSDMELNKIGWLYTTNADVFIYCWVDEEREQLVEAYTLDLPNIIKAFNIFRLGELDKIYGFTNDKNHSYHSECVPVDIDFLTKLQLCQCIYKHPKYTKR
jgi:hypothetical protein